MRFFITSILFLFVSTILAAQPAAQRAFDEGVQLLKNENYEAAEKKFEEAIQKGENKDGLKMSYIYKAYSFDGQGKYDSSLACFTKALEIDPLDPTTYTDRAKTYSYKRDFEKATKDFTRVLELDSSGKQSEAAHYYLGRILMLRGKNDSAVKHFDKLLELVPEDAEGYFLRGTAKSNIMDIDGSIKDFDLAIKYNPDYMEAYANRGVQKINKIPVNEKIGRKDCLPDPCADLLRAQRMGDKTVEDMVFLYCEKCK